jgi:hypothetical protein
MNKLALCIMIGLIAVLSGCASLPSTVSPTGDLPATAEATQAESTSAVRVVETTASWSPTNTPETATSVASAATPIPAVTPSAPISATIKTDALNLRAGPGVEYPTLKKLGQGEQVRVVGQFDGCAWLQVVTTADQQGWISGAQGDASLNAACSALPDGHFRPLTGLVRTYVEAAGQGKLLIKNGTDGDGVAILADLSGTPEPVMAAYIRAGDQYEMTGIPNGVYRLYFAHGELWNANAREFEEPVDRQRFEDTFRFETTGLTYTVWEVTLYAVAGGTAESEHVEKPKFPKLD